MKRTWIILLTFVIGISAYSQNKVPLNHDVYENWKTIQNHQLSDDGKFASFEINPQKGDGVLYVRDIKKKSEKAVFRGYKAKFSSDSRFLAGLIKPQRDSVRAAKRNGKKGDSLPGDSLFIMDLQNFEIEKFPDVRSFKMSEEGKNILIYQHRYIPEDENSRSKTGKRRKDISEKFRAISRKHKLSDLVIWNPDKRKSDRFENIRKYSVSKNGNLVVFEQIPEDTVLRSIIYCYYPHENSLKICHEGNGITGKISCDKTGAMAAFQFTYDTSRNSGFELHLWNSGMSESTMLIDSLGSGLTNTMGVSRNGKLFFSDNSERLFFGTSELDDPVPDDTVLKEDKASLDVWNWKDHYLQPMQIKQLQNKESNTFLACYDLVNRNIVELEDKKIREVITLYKGTGDVMLGLNDQKYGRFLSWEGLHYKDVYYIDPETGEKELKLRKISSNPALSPNGKYFIYYSRNDSTWKSFHIESGSSVDLCKKTGINFYNEENDQPQLPGSYGFAGFSEDDRYAFIYDRYDIWKLDLSGKTDPENLTLGYGRKNRIILRYMKLDREERFINLLEPIYLSSRNEVTMVAGFAKLYRGRLSGLLASGHSYSGLIKSKKEKVLLYRKGNFRDFNDLYLTGPDMESSEKISDANPQAEKYLWGNVQLVQWLSFNADSLKGLLYTPENLDTTRQYPMLVYFYEQYSHQLYSHRIPSPSRSIINPPWCTSNGYVVFIPDIKYTVGYPGQSAYDAVVSGTITMLERHGFIDESKVGIQGQSWGGYQVAWLVTQTNLFAAAMAGAPVSNMTSAYGGIRWGSGMSRMFQYERTQSRIGATLWERQNLYLENSPLFHVPKINTPVLIMHNDKDGAVPWYQGIEYFVALRRLNKPSWMLTYNNEEHNLTRWANRLDLDIRMMQFFDHYLKDKPMPAWMSEGVSASEKNKINGRKLLELN